MPRPPCDKKINHCPPCGYFKPAGIPLRYLQEITLKPEEAEAIRLADCEDLYRADAAQRMGVSRQTFDRIVRIARKKVACVISQGYALRIERTPYLQAGTESPQTANPPA